MSDAPKFTTLPDETKEGNRLALNVSGAPVNKRAQLDRVLEALRNADASGNVEDARKLAELAKRLKTEVGNVGYGASDYVQSFAGGVNRGLAAGAGAPVDLANLGLSQIGLGSERPFLGSRWLRENVYESSDIGRGMIAPGAEDRLGRVLSRTGEEIGATAIPALGITGAATRIAPRAQSVWGAFANPIRETPGRAVAGEALAATGAGAGAGVAQEAFPDSQLAETTGQVLGGLAPTALLTTPTGMATRAAVNVAKRFSPAAAQRAGENAVSDLLGQEITPQMSGALKEADRLRQAMPGFEPSLGETTGSASLLAQQRRIEDMASGEALDKLSARHSGSVAAVNKFAESRAPGRPGGPDFIVDSASRSLEDMRAGVAAEDAAIAGRAQDIAGGLPTADRAAAGQTLRDKIVEARTDARTQLDALANDLGINDVDLTVPFAKFRSEIVDELQPKSTFEDTSNYPKILDDIKGLKDKDTITFQDVKALRERLSDDLTDAMSGANPNRKKVRVLTLMKRRLDEFIGGLDGEFGQAADKWRGFRNEYYDQYIDRFENGVAFKVRQKDGRGFYRTPDEKVASVFFEPGNTSAARQFRKVYGADQEANAALEAVAMDSLRQAAVRDGRLNPGLLKTWIRKHESVLKEYPAIRQAVDDVFKAQRSIDARQSQLQARARAIEDQRLARELDAYSRKATTAGDVVDIGILSDPRRTKELMTFLKGKPEAVQAFQRHVWETIGQKDSQDILRILRDNADSLGLIFEKRHLMDLGDIALARSMLERTRTPRGTALVPRPGEEVEKIIGQGLPQLASRLFAWKSGRMQKGYLATDTLLRGLRGRAAITADDLLQKALYDPDLARELANAVRSGKVTPETASRLQARLFALGIPYLEDEQ